MLIKRRRGWELGENQATPESHYLQRRELVRAMGLGALALTVPSMALADSKDPSAALYPAKRNDKYGVPAPMTEERRVNTYNNYYEFGTDKDSPSMLARNFKPEPWTVAHHEHQGGRNGQRGQATEDGEQQDLRTQDGAVDRAAVDRVVPEHVGPDVHEGHEGLVEHGEDQQRHEETDAEALQP